MKDWQEIYSSYAKTIITLSSALLALSVSFSKDLLPKAVFAECGYLLVLIWFSLTVTIVSALTSSGYLVRYMRAQATKPAKLILSGGASKLVERDSSYRKLAISANVSYLFFGCAMILFLVLGIIAVSETS